MNYTDKPCAPRARCRQWRTCPACAKIRQARFADRAEHAAKQMQLPTYYVLVPDDKTPTGIEYSRRFFVRQTRPASGVWSIEDGKHQAGFHLNVISDWCQIDGRFKGHIYQQPINSSVRAVAAYMTKAERAATPEQGFARQTGHFGQVASFLAQNIYEQPLVAAAQLQHELDPHFMPASTPGPETAYLTARRWLDALWTENEAKRNAKG